MDSAVGFDQLIAIRLTPDTSPQGVRRAAEAGVVAGEVYPHGVTTGSTAGGAADFESLTQVYGAMKSEPCVVSPWRVPVPR